VTQSTGYECQNGILGEYFVYKLLQNSLSYFGPDNWTSELRGGVPDFQDYVGSSVADFKYEDCEGELTNLLYGAERKEAWRDQWPTYHLEVKATSGKMAQQYAFHMSRRQVETALYLTSRDPDSIPKEIYVIFRVYDVRASLPSYIVYTDPHRLLHDGDLRIVSDVDVLPTEGG